MKINRFGVKGFKIRKIPLLMSVFINLPLNIDNYDDGRTSTE